MRKSAETPKIERKLRGGRLVVRESGCEGDRISLTLQSFSVTGTNKI